MQLVCHRTGFWFKSPDVICSAENNYELELVEQKDYVIEIGIKKPLWC